jgi:hypothetical protein
MFQSIAKGFTLPNLKFGFNLAGLIMLGMASAVTVNAADFVIYDDALAGGGWDDWSWSTTDVADASLKVSGASSLKVTYSEGWAGLYLHTTSPVGTANYTSINFSAYGRPGSGSLALTIKTSDSAPYSPAYTFTPVPNVWTEYQVPLGDLGNPNQISQVIIQENTGNPPPAYNLDNLRLVGKILPPVSLAVDATAARKAISPLIYGINNAGDKALMQSLGATIQRWGGNNTTRFNWKIDAWNLDADWYFENYRAGDGTNLTADSAVNRLIAQNRSIKADSLITVPMIGYVAKDSTSCGFSAAKYGAQKGFCSYGNCYAATDQWRPDCGTGVKAVDGNQNPTTYVTGNDPKDTSLVVGPAFMQSWVAYLTNRFGTANNGGVRYYNLDNEPDIWWDTHRDVSPVGMKYDQFRDRTYQYAAAIKTADPAAQTLGPVVNGWTYYWNSPYDGQREDWATPDDRNAHGGTPFVPWYLQQMKAYETAHGVRLLDFLDLHYYPAADNVSLSTAVDAATQQRRLNSTRSLWDATYVDESWIADAGPDGGIVKLIPRMRDWVKNNYPGTKLAITEYNWGALNHINGALAQADVLGIFGREGLDLATLWSPPTAKQPGAFAFRMYRNYNGAGGMFGETSVKASSTDQGRLAVYAAEENATGALTLMVINKTSGALSSKLALSHFTPTGTLQGWRYSAAQLGSIAHLADKTFTGTAFTASYPANSITLYRVAGQHQ